MKRGTADHPKMKRLGRRVGKLLGLGPEIGRHVATSIMIRLWEWSSRYAQDGDIGCFDLVDIGEALQWPGQDPADLIDVLIECELIQAQTDGGLIVRRIRRREHPRFQALRDEIRRDRASLLALLIRRDGPDCQICASEGPPYHIDHVVPLSRGGKNDLPNLQLLCPPCNLRKGDSVEEDGL